MKKKSSFLYKRYEMEIKLKTKKKKKERRDLLR